MTNDPTAHPDARPAEPALRRSPDALAPDLPRSIGFLGGAAIMIGVTIGSGIFRSPTVIAQNSGSPALILLLWVAGGLLSLCGAITYAELAAMYPHSGGIYVFLREGLGRMVAFVFGWTYMLLTKPFAAAAIAFIFSEYLNRLLGTSWNVPYLTCAFLITLTVVNTFRVRVGATVAITFTALKILALVAIVALGLLLQKGAAANFHPTPNAAPLWTAITLITLQILWTYDGWSDIGSVAGEIRDPQRTLPRVYLLGTAFVIVLYVAVNAVYIWLVPLSEMATVETVAPLVMRRLAGPAADWIVTLIVVVSTAGATHASIITGARVTYAQARDGLLFRFLAQVPAATHTPVVALWTQLALSCVAVLYLQDFQALADGFVFTMWIFYGLAAVALLILRRIRPDHPRPYRCWGYPYVPLLFILAAAAVTAQTIREKPWNETLPWLGLLVAGAPAYSAWIAISARAARSASSDE
jgi:amino acid transporter